MFGGTGLINKQKVMSVFMEGLDFLLVIMSVLIVGVIGLYYNVFLIELQDILGYKPTAVSVVQSYEAAAEIKKSSYVQDSLEDLDEVFSLLEPMKGSEKVGGLYEYSMDNFLANKLGSYDLPFNTVPPGRFISIPSIGVQAPIVSLPYASEEKIINGDFVDELRQGIVKYPNTTEPGKIGNTLIFGHSSVDMLQAKNEPYGHVFYRLPKLQHGDLIQVVWDGEIFDYEVTEKSIKRPKDVPEEVNKKVGEDVLTLMACYPLMSDAQRILIKALPRK